MNGSLRAAAVAAALALAAVLAVAQAVQAWASLQRGQAHPAWLAPGAQVSVLLTNGQVYYGEIAEQGPAGLRLVNVYYVQTLAGPSGAPPGLTFARLPAAERAPGGSACPDSIPIRGVIAGRQCSVRRFAASRTLHGHSPRQCILGPIRQRTLRRHGA